MSQNDFTIANQGFPAFRADLNSALQALASNNSGATEPSTMFANMWWYDSANNIMYIRNEDNDAWIKFAELDQANDKFVLSGTLQLDDGTVSAPALTFNSDTNMGIYRGGTDILKFVTAGTDAITIDASQNVTFVGLTTASKANDSKQLKLERTGSSVGSSFLGSDTSAALHIFDSGSNPVATFYQNQDVAFYEDTGTTAKLFWDASAEALGIGTTAVTGGGGAQLRVLGSGTNRNEYYSPAGQYYGSFGLIDNTDTAGWIAVDSSYSQNSAVSAGIFLSPFHSDANGTFCGHTIKSLKSDSALTFSSVVTAGSTGSPAPETERMRIDSSGNLLVGTTDTAPTADGETGFVARASGYVIAGMNNQQVMLLNRSGTDGDILQFRKSGSAVGSISSNWTNSTDFTIKSNTSRLILQDSGGEAVSWDGSFFHPWTDDAIDLGYISNRWDDVYATNGTIQTSDQNEKNTITDSDLGIDFIKRLTPKSYIFNGKTRTHYGLIAQDVETVLTDINKPTSGFAGFIKTDISEEQDGSEYRYGLRYTEFVAPLIQAVKDQQATIDALTARITALENGE